MRLPNLTTLIYITRGDECLFIRKTRENDMNHDKWLGIGGHFEDGESPEECICRETEEETGITRERLTDLSLRGIVTFVSDEYGTEYMHVFTAVLELGYELPITGCDEGELSWVSLADIRKLPVWEGDLLMFDCLFGSRSFFTLKLTYDGSRLAGHNVKLY